MKAHPIAGPGSIAQRLQALLGPCVLLACKGKRPVRKAWQRLTLEEMSPAYLEALEVGNIGVSLGQPSRGLISIDFDTDGGLASFIRQNPALASTLQTRGRRGGNLWLRIHGEIPASRKLVDGAGLPAGELRSTGNQTIIHGMHPDTHTPYTIVVDRHPVEIEASVLVWCAEAHPADWRPPSFPPECDRECIEDKEAHRNTEAEKDSATHLCASTALYHTGDVDRAVAALDAQRIFEQRNGANVARLYDRLVDRRFTAVRHGRNDFITTGVPFLFRALSAERVLEFSMQFYLRHQAIFRDPADQHEGETRAMIEATNRTYHQELCENERNLYDRLTPRQQDAFRVCRDLAFNTSDSAFPPPLFYLTCQDLGDRVGLSCEQGGRLLNTLTRLAIIGVHQRGTSHTKGERGRATVYLWQLSTLP